MLPGKEATNKTAQNRRNNRAVEEPSDQLLLQLTSQNKPYAFCFGGIGRQKEDKANENAARLTRGESEFPVDWHD